MLTLAWDIDILSEKITLETEGWIWKTPFTLCFWGWEVHAKPAFFFNHFIGDWHNDALFVGLYPICLIIGNTLGEGTI